MVNRLVGFLFLIKRSARTCSPFIQRGGCQSIELLTPFDPRDFSNYDRFSDSCTLPTLTWLKRPFTDLLEYRPLGSFAPCAGDACITDHRTKVNASLNPVTCENQPWFTATKTEMCSTHHTLACNRFDGYRLTACIYTLKVISMSEYYSMRQQRSSIARISRKEPCRKKICIPI